jgi:peptidoglycan/xylan/chitin deacetylase (PgdA/CDA1 family)
LVAGGGAQGLKETSMSSTASPGSPAPRAPRASGLAGRAKARLFGTVVGVRTAAPAAALTFDDGPDPESTPALLGILARHRAKGTFFLVGKRAARHPELVARLLAEGHAIGNHSWDHPSLPRLPFAGVAGQLRRAAAAIDAPLRLMRPPYGDQSLASHLAARRFGYTVVTWGVVGADWAEDDGAAIAGRILGGLHPGAIVLLHDTLASFTAEACRDRGPMLAAVETVLAARPDWRFLTVPGLMALGPPRRRYWIQSTDPAYLAGLSLHPDLAG